jgi:hypothetical protein
MVYTGWLVFIAAALPEVAGAVVVRKDLRGSSLIAILPGFAMLGWYGVVGNMGSWDFSKLLGTSVVIFALSASCSGGSCLRKPCLSRPGWDSRSFSAAE